MPRTCVSAVSASGLVPSAAAISGARWKAAHFPLVLSLVVSRLLVPRRHRPQLLPLGPFQWQSSPTHPPLSS